MAEYLIVKTNNPKPLYIDRIEAGSTNQTVEVERGHHLVHVGHTNGPGNLVFVSGTAQLSPFVLELPGDDDTDDY